MANDSNRSSNRLTAVGTLNGLPGNDWVSIADRLASLSIGDYTQALRAFELYRKAHEEERRLEQLGPHHCKGCSCENFAAYQGGMP